MKTIQKINRILFLIALFLFVNLMFTSCEKDDVECKCDLEVTIDGDGSYFVTGVTTDCNGNYDRPKNIPPEHFILGLRNCD